MDPNTVQAIVVEEEEPEPDAESSLSSELQFLLQRCMDFAVFGVGR